MSRYNAKLRHGNIPGVISGNAVGEPYCGVNHDSDGNSSCVVFHRVSDDAGGPYHNPSSTHLPIPQMPAIHL